MPGFQALQSQLADRTLSFSASSSDASSSHTDMVSARLGEKMVTGWKLLDQACDICMCPLLSRKNLLFCAGCNKDVTDDFDVSGSVAPTFSTTSSTASKPPISSFRVLSSTEVSKLMAEKMLAGWAMLAVLFQSLSCVLRISF